MKNKTIALCSDINIETENKTLNHSKKKRQSAFSGCLHSVDMAAHTIEAKKVELQKILRRHNYEWLL